MVQSVTARKERSGAKDLDEVSRKLPEPTVFPFFEEKGGEQRKSAQFRVVMMQIRNESRSMANRKSRCNSGDRETTASAWHERWIWGREKRDRGLTKLLSLVGRSG